MSLTCSLQSEVYLFYYFKTIIFFSHFGSLMSLLNLVRFYRIHLFFFICGIPELPCKCKCNVNIQRMKILCKCNVNIRL